jgi:hypothetical protein
MAFWSALSIMMMGVDFPRAEFKLFLFLVDFTFKLAVEVFVDAAEFKLFFFITFGGSEIK